MPYLVAVWFVFASITGRGLYYDLQEEKQLVKLFEQTKQGYRTYYVPVKG